MTTPRTPTGDARPGLQAFLLLDAVVRLFVWWSPLALTAAAFAHWRLWPAGSPLDGDLRTAWAWGQAAGQFAIAYNLLYVAHLLVLRLPIPTPREGSYRCAPGARPDRQLLYSALLATLTKARMQAPFPGFLVFHAASLPPLSWLMGRVFGPRSRSASVTEPTILDPHLVEVGRNVVIGFGTTIAAHYQEHDRVHLRRTIIEDDVLIGGHAALSGVHVKRGAVIGAGSIVLPGSVVGENEYWSGNPARRRAVLPPVGQRDGPTPPDPAAGTGAAAPGTPG